MNKNKSYTNTATISNKIRDLYTSIKSVFMLSAKVNYSKPYHFKELCLSQETLASSVLIRENSIYELEWEVLDNAFNDLIENPTNKEKLIIWNITKERFKLFYTCFKDLSFTMKLERRDDKDALSKQVKEYVREALPWTKETIKLTIDSIKAHEKKLENAISRPH